jgi:hypothetical protein
MNKRMTESKYAEFDMTTELFSGSDLFVKELSYPGTLPALVMFPT